MNDLPDVLDHLGKTPCEVGSVQVHVEPVIRADDDRAVAVVWCQAAIAPLPPINTLEVLSYRFRLPVLENGVVWRGRLPLHVPKDVRQLLFAIGSDVLEQSTRVRPAWKLVDTWEMPAVDTTGGAMGLLGRMVTLPVDFVLAPATKGTRDAGPIAPSVRVLKAGEPPPGCVAEVLRGEPAPVAAVEWLRVWRPGEELPTQAPALWGDPSSHVEAQQTASAGGLRRCDVCDFAGRRADFGADRYCPHCGSPWG